MANTVRNTISFDVNLNEVTSINDFCKKASKEDFPIDVISGRYVVNGDPSGKGVHGIIFQ